MPDISLCANKECPSYSKCYRAQAVPNEFRQAYGMFRPKEGKDSCRYFWPLELVKGEPSEQL